jgi:multiple sugar transport system permease protein
VSVPSFFKAGPGGSAGQAELTPQRASAPIPGKVIRRLLLYATCLVVCLAVLFPVYWMLVTSVRPTRFTISYPPAFLPEEIRWVSYLELFQTVPIATWLRNTTLVSLGVSAICLVLSVLGGYALSKFRWRGRTIFGFTLLGSQMLPDALLVIPMFIIFRSLNLIDTLHGLVLADAVFVVPVGVWILKSFFDTIPREVCDAALVDGCGPLGVLWRVVLPLSKPALVTVAVVGFFDGWNEYLFASTFITSAALRPTSVGLASFIGELATPVELVFAATAIFSIPPMIFYLIMQRQIVSGLTGGAIKG